MSPADLIADLRARGLTVRASGAAVLVGPRDRVGPAQAEAVAARKDEVLRELRREALAEAALAALPPPEFPEGRHVVLREAELVYSPGGEWCCAFPAGYLEKLAAWAAFRLATRPDQESGVRNQGSAKGRKKKSGDQGPTLGLH